MTEKTIQEVNSEQMKERFQFVLTINDNIVCQRYFRINGFKENSKNSYQLKDTLHRCVEMIKNDLAYKSNVYNWLTAPSVFETKEEMMASLPLHARKMITAPEVINVLDVASFVVISSTNEVFVWNGVNVEPYNGYFNLSDYVGHDDLDDQKCTLKLSFYDGTTEVISEVFDGSCYQRFVRSNIDLSNSKNKYKQGAVFSQYEATLVDEMNKGRKDLIPMIVREFCLCCSYDDSSDYTTKDTFGSKKYFFNLNYSYNRMVSSLERKCKNKTDKYFKELYEVN